MKDRLQSLIDTFFCGVDIDKFYIQNQKEKLADWLRENGVIVPPCKVGDMVEKFFSHNTVIALWYSDPTDKHYSIMLWQGMGWNIPENYKSLPFVKFMGIVAESIDKSDTLNIEVELTKEEEQALKGAEEK